MLARHMGFSQAFPFATAEEVFEEYKTLTAGTPIHIAGVSYVGPSSIPVWSARATASSQK